ncbi:aspartate 1-decarboxylase [Streptomyces sp. NBC_01224]|nr:aspartate 1-decarboxylase [Streptomyces sp. NBC_01224]
MKPNTALKIHRATVTQADPHCVGSATGPSEPLPGSDQWCGPRAVAV